MTRWDAGRGFAGGVRGTRAAAPPTNGRRYECGDQAGCGFAGGVQGAAPLRRFAPTLPDAGRAKWGWGVNRWESRLSFAMRRRGPFGHKKNSPRAGADRRTGFWAKKAKKEAALDCDTHPIFHTVKGYFSVFLVSNILATSLSTDFLLLCRFRDSQSAILVGSLPRPQK